MPTGSPSPPPPPRRLLRRLRRVAALSLSPSSPSGPKSRSPPDVSGSARADWTEGCWVSAVLAVLDLRALPVPPLASPAVAPDPPAPAALSLPCPCSHCRARMARGPCLRRPASSCARIAAPRPSNRRRSPPPLRCLAARPRQVAARANHGRRAGLPGAVHTRGGRGGIGTCAGGRTSPAARLSAGVRRVACRTAGTAAVSTVTALTAAAAAAAAACGHRHQGPVQILARPRPLRRQLPPGGPQEVGR